MITKNELRNSIHSFSNEKLISKYNGLRDFMFRNPKLVREGDILALNLLKFEMKERNIIIE